MGIEFDPRKAAANLRKHGVGFAHAEQALRDPLALTIEDESASGEQRFVTMGVTRWGESSLSCTRSTEATLASFPRAKLVEARWSSIMRKEYDFSKAKRSAVIASRGKTRITIMLDDDVIEFFRSHAEAKGVGYQTMINSALREVAEASKKSGSDKPLTVATLRKVLREELRAA